MDSTWITGIHASDAFKVWPRIAQWVANALDHGSLETPEEVLAKILTRDRQLWMVFSGAELVAHFTTEIQVFGHGKSLHLVTIGGNGADDWLPIVDETLVIYARQMGCRRVSSSGRRGWSRKLDKLGWRDVAIVRTKEV